MRLKRVWHTRYIANVGYHNTTKHDVLFALQASEMPKLTEQLAAPLRQMQVRDMNQT